MIIPVGKNSSIATSATPPPTANGIADREGKEPSRSGEIPDFADRLVSLEQEETDSYSAEKDAETISKEKLTGDFAEPEIRSKTRNLTQQARNDSGLDSKPSEPTTSIRHQTMNQENRKIHQLRQNHIPQTAVIASSQTFSPEVKQLLSSSEISKSELAFDVDPQLKINEKTILKHMVNEISDLTHTVSLPTKVMPPSNHMDGQQITPFQSKTDSEIDHQKLTRQQFDCFKTTHA